MTRTHRVPLPPRFAERLSAEQRAAEAQPIEPADPWQTTADLARCFLVISSDPAGLAVSVDVDRCTFLLGEAADRGCLPTPTGVAALRRAWLTSTRWPCFPAEDAPPLLRIR